MKTTDFDYLLPESLIAQTPIEPRDHSKLMILDRTSGEIKHRHFFDILDYLIEGDVMVFNDSRVIPARLYGKEDVRGHEVELLLLSQLQKNVWRSLVKPGRRMRAGSKFVIGSEGDSIEGEVIDVEKSGTRIVRLDDDEKINDIGVVPLPPYIKKRVEDPERYQTVYSHREGSIAAPTAGLHFTKDLLSRIREKGVKIVFVTLHVGWDSFRPIKTEDPEKHEMHSEFWELSSESAETINKAKLDGRRIFSVGTTAVRLLENAANLQKGSLLRAGSGWADIFITPGYKFKIVDNLITNFHLPKSTLLMLTSAISSRELIMRAYADAVQNEYRFYSFGDAMLIL